MSKKNSWYRILILKKLYFSDTVSCAYLSSKINLSVPLTSKILNELIKDGLVIETGFAPSTGGRRPLLYKLKVDFMYLVSVAMDQYITRIVIMDMQNRFVTPVKKFKLPLENNGDAVYILAEKIAEVVDGFYFDKEQLVGIGIGMPGFVDGNKGVNYSFLKSGENTITEVIAKKTGLPVYIDNDSSLIALAELRFGAARMSKNAMVINIGWGIGLGLVINKELFRGHNGFAGEFSHLPLFFNNKLCRCGKRGCLETESSLEVVVEKAISGIKAGSITSLDAARLSENNFEKAIELIMEAAKAGDRFAVELLSEAGYNIGRGVAILIHLLNPEVIILSGRGSKAGKLWLTPIQQALNEHCIPSLAANTLIELSDLGYHAELIGAAALVMENFEKEAVKKRSKKEYSV